MFKIPSDHIIPSILDEDFPIEYKPHLLAKYAPALQFSDMNFLDFINWYM